MNPAQIDNNGWRAAGGGANALSKGFSAAAGWGLETILTMALVFTVFAATDAERASDTSHLPVGISCQSCCYRSACLVFDEVALSPDTHLFCSYPHCSTLVISGAMHTL